MRPRVALAAFAIVCALYSVLLHPWLMNWGATATEQGMTLPGMSWPARQ